MLSIIVPIFNSEEYIEECLNSLMRQSYQNIEIICINDGSTDRSLDIVQECAKRDARLVVINQKNKGQSAARNAGLKIAKGKYITFIDSDDFIEKKTYIEALEHIEENDLVCFGIKVFGDAHLSRRKNDDSYYGIKFTGQHIITDKLLQKIDCSVCNKIFKKEILDRYEIYFPEGIHYEDAEFFFKYAFASENIYFIDEYFYNYRRRNGSIMSQTFNGCDFAIEHLYIIEHIYDYLNKFNLLTKYMKYFLYIFESYFFLAYYNSDEKFKEEALKIANKYAIEFKVSQNDFVKNLKKRNYKRIFEPKTKFLQKLFSIKNSLDKTHKIITICGVKIKLHKKSYLYILRIIKLLKFYLHLVKKNTILIVEPNDFHFETLLGYYKYLKELNFNIEILTRGKCENLFKNNTYDMKIWECEEKTFDLILKYANFSKYYCLIFNSKRIYWKNNNANNDGYDIENCYKKIPHGKTKNIYVQHHIDMWEDCKKEKQIVLANPLKDEKLVNYIVNPHYFGEVNITTKNINITKFITVGGLFIARRNSKLLLNAVECLHAEGIRNFEIIVIGLGELENINPEIRRYFRVLGRTDFPTMFNAMEEADFFLPLLDPVIEQHQRYMKYGTSGSFQLIYGFLKPCIIHKTFADIYDFTESDSFVYEENSDLGKIMEKAIDISNEEYVNKQEKLRQKVENIEMSSIKNLKRMLYEKK